MSKKIEIRDFYDFTFLSNISFSPDGKSAVFFTHQPDEKKNAYKTRLWLLDVDSGKIKPMTAGCQGGKRTKDRCGQQRRQKTPVFHQDPLPAVTARP